jgi:N-acetyl-anhydromuramyl-L-alanine amidase AmpD
MDIGAREIRKWHTEPPPVGRGWADIGYHYVIRRNGMLEAGRDINHHGAHTVGHNKGSIGICLVGGVAKDGKTPTPNFEPQQWDALKDLLRHIKSVYPSATIHGHNEYANKACPSFDVGKWVKTEGL